MYVEAFGESWIDGVYGGEVGRRDNLAREMEGVGLDELVDFHGNGRKWIGRKGDDEPRYKGLAERYSLREDDVAFWDDALHAVECSGEGEMN